MNADRFARLNDKELILPAADSLDVHTGSMYGTFVSTSLEAIQYLQGTR
jgi:hypothetical protein